MKDRGLDHYWEITVGADDRATDIAIWHLGSDRLPQRISGGETAVVSEPFPMEITPASIIGTALRLYVQVAELRARVAEQKTRLVERNNELAERNTRLVDRKTRLTERNKELTTEVRELRRQVAELDPD